MERGTSSPRLGEFFCFLVVLLLIFACFGSVIVLSRPEAPPAFGFLRASFPFCPEETTEVKAGEGADSKVCHQMRGKNFITYLPHSRLFNQKSELTNALLLAIFSNRTLIVPPLYLGESVSYGLPPGLFFSLQKAEQKTNNVTNHHNYYNHYQHIQQEENQERREEQKEGQQHKKKQKGLLQQIRQQIQLQQMHELWREEGGEKKREEVGERDKNSYKTTILPFSAFYSSELLEEYSVAPADFITCFNGTLTADKVTLAWDEQDRYTYRFSDIEKLRRATHPRFRLEVPISSLLHSPSQLIFLGSVFGSNRVNDASSAKLSLLKKKLSRDFRIGGPVLDTLMSAFFGELDRIVGGRWGKERRERKDREGGGNQWVKERRNYVGIHFRAGDNEFAEQRENQAKAIMNQFFALLCNKNDTNLEGDCQGGGSGSGEGEGEEGCEKRKPKKKEPKFDAPPKFLSGKYRNKCIDPDNLVIYLASDVPPSHSLPLFSPILNLSQTTQVFTLFDMVPTLIRSLPPPVYDRSTSFSPFLHPFNSLLTFSPPPPPSTPLLFPAKNYFCPKRLTFENFFFSFLPIVDILGTSRGEFFIGTPGSTASAAALETHLFGVEVSDKPPPPSHPPPSDTPSINSSRLSCFSSPSSCVLPSFSFHSRYEIRASPARANLTRGWVLRKKKTPPEEE